MSKKPPKLKIGIIIGWNLKKLGVVNKVNFKSLKTPYGKVHYYQVRNCFFIPRHGIKKILPLIK